MKASQLEQLQSELRARAEELERTRWERDALLEASAFCILELSPEGIIRRVEPARRDDEQGPRVGSLLLDWFHPAAQTGLRQALERLRSGEGIVELSSHTCAPDGVESYPSRLRALREDGCLTGIVWLGRDPVRLSPSPPRQATCKMESGVALSLGAVGGETAAATPSATVLLVDDNAQLRGMAGRQLAHAGYVVLDADDGLDALAIVARHTGPLDLVVTDLAMPRMSGVELLAALLAERPELRALAITGQLSPSDAGWLRARGVPVLSKPFGRRELLERVRALLEPGE